MTASRPLNSPYRTEAANALAHGPFTMPRFILTERLVLCPLEMSHHGPFAQFCADAEAMRFMGGAVDASGALARLSTMAGQWALFGFGHYAICDRDGAFLGGIGLYMPIEWPEPEIAYFLMPGAQGKGYAGEAVGALREEAARRGVTTLVSYIDPKNAASIAVAQKTGAHHEGAITLRGTQALVYRHQMDAAPVDPPPRPIPYFEPQAMPRRITTQRLSLSIWDVRHFEPFAAMMADEATTRFTTGPLERGVAWRAMCAGAGSWLLRGYGTYAMEHDGAFVGCCGLYHPHDWPQVELAFTLCEEARGRGFAAEAAEAVRRVAGLQGLDQLVSYIHPRNEASKKLAARLGATLEGDITLSGEPALVYRHPMIPPAPHEAAA